MEKRETVAVFRQRLIDLIARSGQTRARFAARAGLDRSTLSLLLSAENVRLPRADTIARIASRNGASVDWLLGLSEEQSGLAGIVSQPMVETGADDPASEHLRRWLDEAANAKLRYVPSSIPDQVKTDSVIAYENSKLTNAAAAAMAESSRARIAHARRQESEIEVCSSFQSVEMIARGQGIWNRLALRERRRQLEHMAGMIEQLYPSYRWFLFDGRERFAAPYTVFGNRRAAMYVGSMYFVFTSTEHIRVLTQHFEDLIRQSRIQPNETALFIRRLVKELA